MNDQGKSHVLTRRRLTSLFRVLATPLHSKSFGVTTTTSGVVSSTIHRPSLNGWRRRRFSQHQENNTNKSQRVLAILNDPPDCCDLEIAGPVFGAPLEKQQMSIHFHVSCMLIDWMMMMMFFLPP